MTKTIGNPMSWGMRLLSHLGSGSVEIAAELGGDRAEPTPIVQKMTRDDVIQSIKLGYQDFLAMRSDVLFITLLYPVIGICLFWLTLSASMLPMLFPLIAGFALIGPAAGVGLYQMSRKREATGEAGWLDGFRVVQSVNFGAIIMLSFYLVAVYVLWMVAAAGIFMLTMGPTLPVSMTAFIGEVLTTSAGWQMIVLGTGVGFFFAAAVLATTIVAFPMLLDHHVGIPRAVATSIEVAKTNPGVVALWGFVVACGLVVGALPALLGLVIVMPVLGHATWHLYRRAVRFEE